MTSLASLDAQPACHPSDYAPRNTRKTVQFFSELVDHRELSRASTPVDATFVEVIEPGLVVLRNFADDAECRRLAQLARAWGDATSPSCIQPYYVRSTDGSLKLNTGESRGRIYDAATRFPADVIAHCNEAVTKAKMHDEAMPEMTCTHLLLNMYTDTTGLVWHRDIYENDGRSDHPVCPRTEHWIALVDRMRPPWKLRSLSLPCCYRWSTSVSARHVSLG
jgi:hypothetical protein